VEDDKVMYNDIEATVSFLREVKTDMPKDLLMVRDYSPEDME
jgi:hypothetical protein